MRFWMITICCVVLGSGAAWGTTYGQHYGVVDQWGYETPELGQGSMDIILQNLGAKWIRSGWDWDLIEGPGDDQYDPGYLGLMDNWVVGMNAIGVNILYGFSYTPAWARPGGTGNNTPPTNPAKYTEFITFMVNRYKNSIKYWGFWNEPNIDGFWNGTDDNYVHNFLIPGIAAVKAADPTAKTVVGELASCCNEVSLLQTFLTEINTHGEKGLVDVVSVHGYGYGDTASGRIAHLDSLHNTIVSAGYGDKEFWCTETSWVSGSNEANQANQIVSFMQGMDSRPWWKKTFYFTMSEGIWDDCGLIHPDQSPKLSYSQYQALIADRADDAEMVSDTIPATMVAGRQYVVSVTVKNTGTATWSYDDEHRLGAVGDSDPFAAGRLYLNPGETVVPDATRTFWFPMNAPVTTSTYTTDWRMVHESVRWFGHSLVKQVQVNTNPDTTPPGPVTNFTATPNDGQLTLSWTNPVDADFTKTMIRFKTTGYPSSQTDGTLVVDKSNNPGTSDSYAHTGLTNGVTYYYAALAHDVVPNYSAGATVSAAPLDLTPPSPVTSFTATPGDAQVALAWHNPSASDFAATMIRFRTDTYPTSPTDGTLVIDKAGSPNANDSYTHTGLTNWLTYYYTAFSHDVRPNYSSGANATAKPRGPIRYQEEFAYTNGNLNERGGWHGNATSQIVVEDQSGKVLGGSGSYDATQDLNPSCDGDGTIAAVELKIKRGAGANTFWNVWIDDAAGNNLARWYGSGGSVRGRIGTGGLVTTTQSLTGEWDTLYVKINFSTNVSEFFFNGANIGSLDHSGTGAGDSIGRIRIERINYSSAAGHYVYLDHLVVGMVDGVVPAASVGGPSVVVARTGPVTFDVSFSEPVFGFGAAGDVQVNSTGTAAGTVGVTGSGLYTVTLSTLTGGGTLGITVKSAACADKAGNSNTASSASPTLRVIASDGSLSALKSLPNEQSVELGNKALYLKQGGFAYVEETNRTGGMRLQGTISPSVGDLVCLTGTMKATAGGERYVLVDLISPCGTHALGPLGTNNLAVLDSKLMGVYVKCWGKVKPGSIVGNSYVLTDGSDSTGIEIITPGAPGVVENQFVWPDGAAGWENGRVVYKK